MATYRHRIREVGKERLFNFHKNNKEYLADDETINKDFKTELKKLQINPVVDNHSRFKTVSAVLLNKDIPSDNNYEKNEVKKEKTPKEETLGELNANMTPDEILQAITKDDVKKTKKKKSDTTSLDLLKTNPNEVRDSLSSPTFQTIDNDNYTYNEKPEKKFPHSSKYFRIPNTTNGNKYSVRVVTYDRAFIKDMM